MILFNIIYLFISSYLMHDHKFIIIFIITF
jgi:hypothetical protein